MHREKASFRDWLAAIITLFVFGPFAAAMVWFAYIKTIQQDYLVGVMMAMHALGVVMAWLITMMIILLAVGRLAGLIFQELSNYRQQSKTNTM